MESGIQPRKIAVLGLGYVGCVTAACLSRLGHQVTGVDRDEFKVRSVLDGKAPFYEPGLEALVRENVSAGRLTASASLRNTLEKSEIALICVGTPSEKNGNLGLEQLRRVAAEIGAAGSKVIVAVRSTVFPGTCEEVVAPLVGGAVVSNPEFLREGSAVNDFFSPPLLVVGGSDPCATEAIANLYSGLNVQPCLVSLRTAEMIKYACNAFHAVKIGFANEVGALCSKLGVSGDEVMDTLCRDHALNISPAYLKPGLPFGGSCLPKDLRALNYRARSLDVKAPLLESVLPSNAEHLKRATDSVLSLKAQRLGVFGLTFKENTDDLRESPVVELLEQLIGKGRDIRVFDPQLQLNTIYGSNQKFLLDSIPHIGRLMDDTLEKLLGWAQHVVVAQKPAPQLREIIRNSGLPVLDLLQV